MTCRKDKHSALCLTPEHVPACAPQAALLPARSLERLMHVAAYAVSTYNSVKRCEKPFRNLQNSTYELLYPEKGLRAICEKV